MEASARIQSEAPCRHWEDGYAAVAVLRLARLNTVELPFNVEADTRVAAQVNGHGPLQATVGRGCRPILR